MILRASPLLTANLLSHSPYTSIRCTAPFKKNVELRGSQVRGRRMRGKGRFVIKKENKLKIDLKQKLTAQEKSYGDQKVTSFIQKKHYNMNLNYCKISFHEDRMHNKSIPRWE